MIKILARLQESQPLLYMAILWVIMVIGAWVILRAFAWICKEDKQPPGRS